MAFREAGIRPTSQFPGTPRRAFPTELKHSEQLQGVQRADGRCEKACHFWRFRGLIRGTQAAIHPTGVHVKRKQAKPKGSFLRLLGSVHRNQRGAVSIETVLIIAAIALPILIFVIKFGWPRIKEFFERGMDDLEGGAQDAGQDNL